MILWNNRTSCLCTQSSTLCNILMIMKASLVSCFALFFWACRSHSTTLLSVMPLRNRINVIEGGIENHMNRYSYVSCWLVSIKLTVEGLKTFPAISREWPTKNKPSSNRKASQPRQSHKETAVDGQNAINTAHGRFILIRFYPSQYLCIHRRVVIT